MKKFLFIISILITFTQTIFAQVENVPENQGAGFGSLNIDVRTIENKPALLVGGGGGFLVKNFSIGVFYSGLTNSFSKRDTANISYKLAYSYGGIWIGYAFRTSKPLHFVTDLRISIGDTRLINTNWQTLSNGLIYGVNPSFGIQYSISEIFKISAGIQFNYNYFPKPPAFYTEDAFNSPGIFISAKLGTFNY